MAELGQKWAIMRRSADRQTHQFKINQSDAPINFKMTSQKITSPSLQNYFIGIRIILHLTFITELFYRIILYNYFIQLLYTIIWYNCFIYNITLMNSSRVNCPISYSINERRIASRLLSCDIGAVDDKNFHQREPTLSNIPYLLKVQDGNKTVHLNSLQGSIHFLLHSRNNFIPFFRGWNVVQPPIQFISNPSFNVIVVICIDSGHIYVILLFYNLY